MILTVPVMAEHVSELGRLFGVVIQNVREMAKVPERAVAGTSWTGRPMIAAAPVTDECTYAIQLHELGHWLEPFGHMPDTEFSPQMRLTRTPSSIRDVCLQLEEERAAWRWAQRYALDWTPSMEHVKRLTLASYENAARRLLGRVP